MFLFVFLSFITKNTLFLLFLIPAASSYHALTRSRSIIAPSSSRFSSPSPRPRYKCPGDNSNCERLTDPQSDKASLDLIGGILTGIGIPFVVVGGLLFLLASPACESTGCCR